ncbi:MAG: hypothetical protein HQL19_05475 [Candidatus Omnitrophica bacterium]|nr:hypothetical protein [Candidatus Omnitrophota bacterium]
MKKLLIALFVVGAFATVSFAEAAPVVTTNSEVSADQVKKPKTHKKGKKGSKKMKKEEVTTNTTK